MTNKDTFRLLFPSEEERARQKEEERRVRDRKRLVREQLQASRAERFTRWAARSRTELIAEFRRVLPKPDSAYAAEIAKGEKHSYLAARVCDFQLEHVLSLIELGADEREIAAECIRIAGGDSTQAEATESPDK